MTSYLVGFVAFPVVVAALYGMWRGLRWLHECEWIWRSLSGRMLPRVTQRAAFAAMVALMHRIWMLPLPGDCTIALVVGGGSKWDRSKLDNINQAILAELTKEKEEAP